MNVQTGERYRCSDANCGCEIEVTIPSVAQDESDDEVIGSANDRSIVGSLSNADVVSQRYPEGQAIFTPGDYGSQDPPGEGLFASAENPRPATECTGGGARSFNSGSSYTSRLTGGSAEEPAFSCYCGQPMRKSSSRGRRTSREMA